MLVRLEDKIDSQQNFRKRKGKEQGKKDILGNVCRDFSWKNKTLRKSKLAKMPFLGHEKGQTPRCRRSDDEYVLFLQGVCYDVFLSFSFAILVVDKGCMISDQLLTRPPDRFLHIVAGKN